MKKSSLILPLLAVIFAVGSAFSNAPLITAYIDSNGSASGGAQSVSVPNDCAEALGTICSVDDHWTFSSGANAEANMDEKSNQEASGLLRRPS